MFPAAQDGTQRGGSALPPRCYRCRRRPRRPVAMRCTCGRPTPYPRHPPCHRRCAPADPFPTGQSASRSSSPQPLRRASAREKARSAAAAGSVPADPRHPGPSVPCWAGSGWLPGATLAWSWGEKHYLSPFGVFFRFLSFSFVLFRFVSFSFVFSAGNGRRAAPRSRHAAVPAGNAPSEPAEFHPNRESPGTRAALSTRRAPRCGTAVLPRPPWRRPAAPKPLQGLSAAGACGASALKEGRGVPRETFRCD